MYVEILTLNKKIYKFVYVPKFNIKYEKRRKKLQQSPRNNKTIYSQVQRIIIKQSISIDKT